RKLPRPKKLAVFETQRNNGIARRARRIGIVVASGDIQSSDLFINGRRRPDTGSGRPILLTARSGFTCWLGRVGDGESLPNLLSSCCIQRHDAASERTALKLRITRQKFLERRERLVDNTIVNTRCRSGHGRKMIHRTDSPNQLTCRSVQRIHSGAGISEKHGRSAVRIADSNAGTNLVCFESPVRASRSGVERIDGSRGSCDIYTSTDDRWLRSCDRHSTKIESPFQLQSRHVRGCKRRAASVLESRIVCASTPPVPAWRVH